MGLKLKALAILACLHASAWAQVLHTSGDIAEGLTLQDLPRSQQLVFSTAQTEAVGGAVFEVPLAEVVRWGVWRPSSRHQAVWLQDESWLCGDVTLESSRIRISSGLLRLPDVPLSIVRGVVLNPPESLEQFVELRNQMRAAKGDRDIVWFSGGRKLTGVISIDEVATSGRPGLAIEQAGQSATLELEEVRAIVFGPALFGPLQASSNAIEADAMPHAGLPAGLSLGLRDGSLLNLAGLDVTDELVTCRLEAGLQIRSLDTPNIFVQDILYISNQPQSVQFLADLPTASYRNLSRSLLKWPLGLNQDLWLRPLIDDHGMVARGLALHALSQVAYRWDGTPARLLAEVVPARLASYATEHTGTVRCKVMVAREGKLETATEFELSRSAHDDTGRARALIDVELSGAQLVALLVEPGAVGQYADHVLWLDARIVAQSP